MLNLMEISIKEDVISVVQESSFSMEYVQEDVDLTNLIEIEFVCVTLDLLEMEINVFPIKLVRIINYSGMEHVENAQEEQAYQMIKKHVSVEMEELMILTLILVIWFVVLEKFWKMTGVFVLEILVE